MTHLKCHREAFFFYDSARDFFNGQHSASKAAEMLSNVHSFNALPSFKQPYSIIPSHRCTTIVVILDTNMHKCFDSLEEGSRVMNELMKFIFIERR